MSNVIPIVSSSPPPLDDDDADFKWDNDDDDDYGNFASAPSVSATTVNSDSSFEVNWSTSETSASASDGISKGSPIRSDSKTTNGDADSLHFSHISNSTAKNIYSRKDHLQESFEIRTRGNNYDVIGNTEIDNLGSADFSKNAAVDVSNERTGNNSSLHHEYALSEIKNGSETIVDAEEEDENEFQDFAQFNDTVSTEDWHNSASNTQGFVELSPELNKTHNRDMLTVSSHSNHEGQSSSPDQYSETVVTDSESAVSVHLRNNDSIYSSASTVDSGVFSADLSPSCQPGETSDICTDTEKDYRSTYNNTIIHQTDISTSISQPVFMPPDDKSLETSAKPYKNITSCDNTTSNNNNSQVYVDSDSSDSHCDNNLVSGNDFLVNEISSRIGDISEIRNDIKEEHYGEKFSNKEECHTGEDMCMQNNNECLNLRSSYIIPGNAVESAVGDEVEIPREDELEATDDERDSTVVNENRSGELQTLENNQAEDGESANLGIGSSNEYKSFARHNEDGEISECTVQNKHDLVTSKFDSKLVGLEVSNTNYETSILESSVPVTNFSEDGEEHQDMNDFVDDVKEFGEFTFCAGQSDDVHEVAPITFRTSICEDAEDGGEDVDEFSFDMRRPPDQVDDDGGNNIQEFDGTGKDISDGDDDDDFGDFDSAQNFQHDNSSASLNKNSESFGDFGRSEAADNHDNDADDDGWADFGAAAPPENSSSFTSVTKTQVSIPANSQQSNSQKLRNAVISSFPDLPMPVTMDPSQMDGIKVDGLSPHNDSLKDDESPLPLDIVVDLGLSNALEAKQQTWAVVQHPAKKEAKVRLWSHLKDVDSCHALMYTWNASHCSREVFTTLHIDTQNFLFTHKKQAVPFFASGLGILEPIRGGRTVMDSKKEKSNKPVTHHNLLDSSKSDFQQNSTTQDIPPVDFDWSSSGLTNPLTVFKAESHETAHSALYPIEEILKKTTPTVKLATNEVLSPEAVRVLRKMPDLSFMQSRVLMFPVKQ